MQLPGNISKTIVIGKNTIAHIIPKITVKNRQQSFRGLQTSHVIIKLIYNPAPIKATGATTAPKAKRIKAKRNTKKS